MLQAVSGLALLGAARAAPTPASKSTVPSQFSPATVDELAKGLSLKPYEANHAIAPEALRKLDYKAYNEIRFNPERAFFIDSGSPFRAQLYHLGYLYGRGVAINLVTNAVAFGVPYSAGTVRVRGARNSRGCPRRPAMAACACITPSTRQTFMTR